MGATAGGIRGDQTSEEIRRGGSASQWGLGVVHSILGNDGHYEAPEHFMRAPERAAAVMAAMFSFSFQMSRDAM